MALELRTVVLHLAVQVLILGDDLVLIDRTRIPIQAWSNTLLQRFA